MSASSSSSGSSSSSSTPPFIPGSPVPLGDPGNVAQLTGGNYGGGEIRQWYPEGWGAIDCPCPPCPPDPDAGVDSTEPGAPSGSEGGLQPDVAAPVVAGSGAVRLYDG